VLGCGDADTNLPSPPNDVPQQITYDYHTTQTRGGIPQWELWGVTAERYPGQSTLQLQGVRMVFFKEGKKDAELTSSSGEIDEKTRDTTARGDVVVTTEDGRTLESEVLHWDAEKQLIHTDAFVRFTEGDQVLTGYGLRTDPNLTNLTLERQVQGEIPSESAASEGTQP